MATRAKTIQIFLPDGNPRGIRIADITSRSIAATLVPRSLLDDALTRPELDNVGVYILFGDGDPRWTAYIGEAENCVKRLRDHNRSKDFWTHVLVFTSKTKDFTKTHIKYLEWLALNTAQRAKRCTLENGNVPNEPHVSEPVKADLHDHFDTMQMLASTLGYPVFDEIKKAKPSRQIFCRHLGKGAEAVGEYTESGVIIFAGSKCSLEETPTCSRHIRRLRQSLIDDGLLVEEDGVLVLQADQTFSSPSTAAAVVNGRATNGWIQWKYKDGRTLDEVHRKSG
jgi:hypothetical protein